MTDTTPQPTYRTLTLTGRPPVRVRDDDWPVVAVAKYSDHDGEVECQANRRTTASIRVRQHEDGRAIVTACYDYASNWQHERDLSYRRGELVGALASSPAELPDAIRRVAASMPDDADAPWSELAQECIADLEPETL